MRTEPAQNPPKPLLILIKRVGRVSCRVQKWSKTSMCSYQRSVAVPDLITHRYPQPTDILVFSNALSVLFASLSVTCSHSLWKSRSIHVEALKTHNPIALTDLLTHVTYLKIIYPVVLKKRSRNEMYARDLSKYKRIVIINISIIMDFFYYHYY